MYLECVAIIVIIAICFLVAFTIIPSDPNRISFQDLEKMKTFADKIDKIIAEEENK